MIIVVNKVKKCWNQFEVDAVLEAVSMVCNYYNLERGKILVDFLKPNNTYDGLCHKKSKHTAKIRIYKNSDFYDCILTAVHEATHAKQFLTKELTSDLTWYGKTKYKEYDYEAQPWEIEAVKMEKIFLGEETKTY